MYIGHRIKVPVEKYCRYFLSPISFMLKNTDIVSIEETDIDPSLIWLWCDVEYILYVSE